jgi:hypothetical protein
MRQGVILLKDDDWTRIQPNLQKRIETGVERIRRLCDAIAEEAKVKQMPPIVIAPCAWSRDGVTLMHAAAGAWRDSSARGGFSIGVLACVGVVLCEDDGLVRDLLVHEFAHCFKVGEIVVDHNDLGTSLDELRGDPYDQEREDRLLVEGPDWFGPRDASIMRWGDPRIATMTREVSALVTSGQIRGEQPPIVEPASFNVPEEWKTHVRSLRSRG